jgi:pimeloyl-ACP methyl ester carboxylesterase
MTLPHDEGGSGPAVVLLHAGIADRSMWAEHLQPLAAAGYRAVAVGLPGFGDVMPAGGEQAPWNDVLQTMDELSIEQAALVGNSFGGAVALRMALVAPQRVSALALISAPAPGIEPSAELKAIWQAEEEALERGETDAAVEAVVAGWTLPGAPAELRDRVAAMQRRTFECQPDDGEWIEAPDPVDEHPEALGELALPTLVAAGEHDLPDFRQGADELARTLPGARHTVLRGAGHLAPLETPQAFRELLIGFLKEARRLPYRTDAPR